MSASLFCNPIEHYLSRAAPQIRPEVHRVKRALFGPVDREADQLFVENCLQKIRQEQSDKWEFDFKRGVPLRLADGNMRWKPVKAAAAANPPKRPVCRFEGEDLYAMPEDVVRPTPVRLTKETTKPAAPETAKSQRLITDYMNIKKRPLSSGHSKKSAIERPTKLPRLSELS